MRMEMQMNKWMECTPRCRRVRVPLSSFLGELEGHCSKVECKDHSPESHESRQLARFINLSKFFVCEMEGKMPTSLPHRVAESLTAGSDLHGGAPQGLVWDGWLCVQEGWLSPQCAQPWPQLGPSWEAGGIHLLLFLEFGFGG